MRRVARNLATLLCFVAGAVGAEHAGAEDREYAWKMPPGFPVPVVPADNPMSDAKVALGCRLFFEPRLSVTQRHSCASCHSPQLAFTDARAQALGATGEKLQRSSMSLANVAFSPAFTWANDRTTTLEAQMEQPLFSEHPLEMGLERNDRSLTQWLAQNRSYDAAFRAAFPEAAPLTMSNLIKAIAAFERTLISGRSGFDRYVYDDDRSALSQAARRGMALFFSDRTGCAQCHFGLTFSGPIVHAGAPAQPAIFANNGAHEGRDGDRGLMAVTGREQDRGLFKVPTLRNVELTAPYMHDGRLATLEAVIEHYSSGGRHSDVPGSAPVDSRIRPLDLTAEEKSALLEFLRSLTDTEFVDASQARASACAAIGPDGAAAHSSDQ